MNRDTFEALMEGAEEPGDELELVIALGRLARAQRPARELLEELAEEEEDWEDPGDESAQERLAAADRPRRALPVLYEGETPEGGRLVLTLERGLGGLPTLTLTIAPGPLVVVLDATPIPLQPGQSALVAWLDEAPDELQVRGGEEDVASVLRPT